MRDFRKHAGWYMSGYPVGPEVRRRFSMVAVAERAGGRPRRARPDRPHRPGRRTHQARPHQRSDQGQPARRLARRPRTRAVARRRHRAPGRRRDGPLRWLTATGRARLGVTAPRTSCCVRSASSSSPTCRHRRVRAATGESPTAYVRRLSVEKAAAVPAWPGRDRRRRRHDRRDRWRRSSASRSTSTTPARMLATAVGSPHTGSTPG